MARKTSHLAVQPMAQPALSSNTAALPTTHKAFSEHINELRMRVLWVALVFIVTSAVAYNFRDILVQLVMAPLGDQKLIYLTPAGGFSFIFQITMYAGAVVTAPLLIYHLYKFVVPALPDHARKHSLFVMIAATLLMVGGVSFGYFVAIPAALHFLTNFGGDYVEAALTADSYLGFVLAYVAGLGVLFQLPLLLVFWNWMSPLGPKKLLSSERFVVVFAFVAAAIMTPTPDIMNQSLIALPIIGIYQFGIIAVLVANRSKARKEKRALKVHAGNAQEPARAPIADALPESVFEALFESAHVERTPEVPAPEQVAPTMVTKRRGQARTMDGFTKHPTTLQRPHRVLRPIPVRQLQPRGAVRPGMRSMSLDGISTLQH